MTMDLARKFSAPVPRYTSYPTALSFGPDVGPETYAGWLRELPDSDALSLYVHIPFCKSICWYCGCHAKAVKRPEPIKRYLTTLEAEMTTLAHHIPEGCVVNSLHWGGGSPNSLDAGDITRLTNSLKQYFRIAKDARFAVEIDPRALSAEQAAAFASAGVNRVSLGVQDFDSAVQAAIGRIQSFETTKVVAEMLRAVGISAINVDLVYGLPKQTYKSAQNTIDGVLEINPDRIALFGYAHMPSKFKRQRLVDETAMPGMEKRFTLATLMANRLTQAGYVRIGLDHFAKPSDSLAQGTVHRNFQGYTVDDATTLIGLGVTAISKLPGGYAQNAVPVGDYERSIGAGRLATVRGYSLTSEDYMRAFVIERLMCDLAFPADELRERFGAAADPLIADASNLIQSDGDGLMKKIGNGFKITEQGRPFLRSIAACFDAHLKAKPVAYSTGV